MIIALTSFLLLSMAVVALLFANRRYKVAIRNLEQAEAELKSKYALLAIAGSTADFGGWRVDLAADTVTWTDEVADIHEMPRGYSPRVAESIRFYTPEWRDKIARVFADCAVNGIPYDEEMEIITGAGRRIWVRTVGEAVRDEGGNIVAAQGSFQDITRRKQAEESKQERAERVKQQSSLLAQLTLDDAIVSSSVEAAAKLITAKVAEAMPVDRVSVWLLSEDQTRLQRIVLYDAASGFHSPISVLNTADIPSYIAALRRDGQIAADDVQNDARTRELTDEYFAPLGISSLLDSVIQQSGRFLGVVSFEHRGPIRNWHTDEKSFASALAHLVAQLYANAERKLAEEALRESEERYAEVATRSRTYTWEVDVSGMYTFVGALAEGVIGFSPGDLVGKMHFFELAPAEDRDALREHGLKEIATGADDIGYENRIVTKDGRVIWVLTAGTPKCDKRRKIIGYRGWDTDITERKRAEAEQQMLREQLHQSQKMESIGQLAGGVAHDFNNLLMVIMGCGEMVRDALRPDDPSREDVQQILDTGQRAAHLTRQLLAFSRKQPLTPKVLDLNELVGRLEKMLSRLIGEHITLELILGEDLGRVLADEGQLEQVIMNLAVNARDAMPKGGVLRIQTAQVERERPCVQLTVADTGCGMSKQVAERIFEPFFTTKEKGRGTGLGLATVYGIVKQSGGDISVCSEPGKGTTFDILFPQTDAVMERSVETMGPYLSESGSEQILLVEDEEWLRKMLERRLTSMGYIVHTAANGDEALRLMEQAGIQPDLVVTDLIMPGMNGKEMVDRLRQTRPKQPVLYMSGYVDDSIVPQGMLGPNAPFIPKPFSSDDLAKKVQEVLGHAAGGGGG